MGAGGMGGGACLGACGNGGGGGGGNGGAPCLKEPLPPEGGGNGGAIDAGDSGDDLALMQGQ